MNGQSVMMRDSSRTINRTMALRRAPRWSRLGRTLTVAFKPQHVGDSLQSMDEHRAKANERDSKRDNDTDEDLVLSDTDATGHKWLLCHLDSSDDPVMVLHQLRECIAGRGAALLEVNDSNPSVVLDAILLLCLLEADLDSKIIFRPLRQRADNGCMILRVCKAKQKGGQRSQSIVQVKRVTDEARHNLSPSDMLREVRALADSLVNKVDGNNVACIESHGPTELIVALRALKIARRIVRSDGSDQDLYISPQVTNDKNQSLICFHCWVKSTQSGKVFFP